MLFLIEFMIQRRNGSLDMVFTLSIILQTTPLTAQELLIGCGKVQLIFQKLSVMVPKAKSTRIGPSMEQIPSGGTIQTSLPRLTGQKI